MDDLGLILRAEVVWSKPNGLPESVTDRVRRSHETWLHLVKQPRYFSAVDEIRQPYRPETVRTQVYGLRGGVAGRAAGTDPRPGNGATHPLGALPGSVWSIPSEPLNVPAVSSLDGRPLPDHFAAFPIEWPRRIIQGWSPSGICVECGEGRRPTNGTACDECGAFRPNNAKQCPDCGHRRDWKRDRFLAGDTSCYDAGASTATDWSTPGAKAPRRVPVPMQSVSGGYACACPEPTARTRPAVVLDPFGGTGTTALAASVLGRMGVSVDLSGDYCRLARWRTTDPGERARAMRVEKPPVQAVGQDALDFGEA